MDEFYFSASFGESLRKSQNRRGRREGRGEGEEGEEGGGRVNVTRRIERMARRNRYRIVENFPKPDIV